MLFDSELKSLVEPIRFRHRKFQDIVNRTDAQINPEFSELRNGKSFKTYLILQINVFCLILDLVKDVRLVMRKIKELREDVELVFVSYYSNLPSFYVILYSIYLLYRLKRIDLNFQ